MMLNDFKVMSFDMVGTIIDFEKGVLDAVRRIGGAAAAKLTDDEIFTPYLRGRELNYDRSSEVMKDVYVHLAKELGLPSDDHSSDAFQLAVLRWPPFPDSADALKRLRKRFRLVAMTNADRSAFSFYSHALGNPFHDSVTMDDAMCAKPDPRFFEFTRGRLSVMGYSQAETLHVAQSQHHDIIVATKLGYKTCWIERRQGMKGFGGTPAVAEITKPTFHFSTLKALADAVEAE